MEEDKHTEHHDSNEVKMVDEDIITQFITTLNIAVESPKIAMIYEKIKEGFD